jgi:hypothetical protein
MLFKNKLEQLLRNTITVTNIPNKVYLKFKNEHNETSFGGVNIRTNLKIKSQIEQIQTKNCI